MWWDRAKQFLGDTSGAAFVYVGMVLAAMTGFAGLAIDTGYWYSTQRAAQSAADAAAVAGAYEVYWGGDEAAARTAAQAQAEQNGFDDAAAYVTVTVNSPPLNGPNTTADAVEVIVEAPTSGLFSALFHQKNPITITTRSVAAQVPGEAACITMLDPNGSDAISLNSNSSITANGCRVQVNSSSSTAITTNSGSSLTAESIGVTGDYSGPGISPTPETGVPPLADPLAYLPPPPEASLPCDPALMSVEVNAGDPEESTGLSPGIYCNDLKINAGASVPFNPGIYVIRGGVFDVNASSSVSGTEVMFYLDDGAALVLNSGSTAVLSAPTTGPYAGILFFEDRATGGGTPHVLNSDASSMLVGAVYFPKGSVLLNSGSTFGGLAPHTSIIAQSIEVNSDSHLVLNNDLTSTSVPGVPSLGGKKIAIFE